MINEKLRFSIGEQGLNFKKLNLEHYNEQIRNLKISIDDTQVNLYSGETKINVEPNYKEIMQFKDVKKVNAELHINVENLENAYYDTNINLEEIKQVFDNPSILKVINGLKSRNFYLTDSKEWPKISDVDQKSNTEKKYK
ncbi:MAG: hypothetical protein ACRC4M_03675 [Mycoplasma sp.]